MRNPPPDQNGSNCRGERREIRRISLAGVGARVHVAGAVHQEQMRGCADQQPLRDDGGTLSARILGVVGCRLRGIRYFRRSGEQEAHQQKRQESNRAQTI